MPIIPHTADDVRDMLEAIGAPTTEALFDEIPAELRAKSLGGIPAGLSEMEVGRLMLERAAADGLPHNFIGAGAYEHHVPAAVWAIVTRGEFYSASTPYQAEASQGTLQLLYEYRSMMTSLTGHDASNASLYDGATALRIGNLQGIAPLMVGRPDNNPFYGAFVGDAAAYWAYDPDGGLRIKTRSGATAIDENGIATDQFHLMTADDVPAYTEDRASFYLNKPTNETPRISVRLQVSEVQAYIDRLGDMTQSDFDADNDGVIDLAENANNVPWSGVTGKPATFTPSTHTHTMSQITDYTPPDPSEQLARQWMGY